MESVEVRELVPADRGGVKNTEFLTPVEGAAASAAPPSWASRTCAGNMLENGSGFPSEKNSAPLRCAEIESSVAQTAFVYEFAPPPPSSSPGPQPRWRFNALQRCTNCRSCLRLTAGNIWLVPCASRPPGSTRLINGTRWLRKTLPAQVFRLQDPDAMFDLPACSLPLNFRAFPPTRFSRPHRVASTSRAASIVRL